MKIKKLKEIYPNSSDTLLDNQDINDFYTFCDGQNFIYIPKHDISNNEIKMLDIFNYYNIEQPWLAYLMEPTFYDIPINLDRQSYYQLLFIKISNYVDAKLFIETLKGIVNGYIDAFFLNDNEILLIKSFNDLDKQEFLNYLDMIDDDFSIKSTLYIGIPSTIDNLPKSYKEEYEIFHTTASVSKERIISFIDLYIHYYLVPHIVKSNIIQEIGDIIKQHQEYIEIIEAMWIFQGNITSSANHLYIHRNTLNYRIDKLYEETKINIRNIDELLLVYLAIQ